ncbi:unnamed protein product [Prunus armeniaca]
MNCFQAELPVTRLKKEKSTLERQKEGWNSISTWIEASDPGWTGYVCAGLDCQQLQLLELQHLQSEKGRSGWT